MREKERVGQPRVMAYEAGAVMALDPAPLAAISVSDSGGELAAALWRVDAETGKPTAWRVSVREDDDRATDARTPPPAVLAVRAVELLHASLTGVELDAPQVFPPPPPRAAAVVVAAPPPPPPRTALVAGRLTLGAGIALHGAPGGLGAAPAATLRVGAGFGRGPAFRLVAVGLGRAPTVRGQAGSASVGQETIALQALFPLRAGARLEPFLLLGAGGYHARVVGRPAAGFAGARDASWALLGAAGAGLALRLPARTALLAEAEAQLVTPALRIRLAGAEAGRTGRPSLVGSLSFVAGL